MQRRLKHPVTSLVIVCLLLTLSVRFIGGAVQASSTYVEISPGQGISFRQVDFTWPGATTLNSDTVQIDIDVDTLHSSTGIPSGYINVVTSLGWVVQNLPVLDDFPYAGISSNFRLYESASGAGTDTTSLDAYVELSSEPVTSVPSGSPQTFMVGDVSYNAQGFGGAVGTGTPPPPPVGVIDFNVGGVFRICWQPGHQCIETAQNQCLPAAVATSLQWLEDTYASINIPHPNVMGLGDDGSLVGALELEMKRTWRSRRDGDPVSAQEGLSGKLCYLDHNDITLRVKHQGLLGGSNYYDCHYLSYGQGTVVTADFIIKELCKGEDVELGFLYASGGGHFVEVVGAGTILGKPWIAHKSDHDQSDDTKGTDIIDFTFLEDSDGDGDLNLVSGKAVANVAVVFTQSPIIGGGLVQPAIVNAEATASTYIYIVVGTLVLIVVIAAGFWYIRRRKISGR